MKWMLSIFIVPFGVIVYGQNLQLHYDLQHTALPGGSTKNHPTVYFEYFKLQDSGSRFVKPGSFLFKTQADFTGDKNSIGKFFVQVSQTLRCWQPDIFLHLQYSGGAGITEPKQYSYYIRNTFSAGVSYPFRWGTAWLTAVIDYKLVAFKKASSDPLLTLYWWKGLFHYKAEVLGDFSLWTENKNHGDDPGFQQHGKQFFFFAEPQFWYNVARHFAVGTRMSCNYHVLSTKNKLQCYPSLAVRCKLSP